MTKRIVDALKFTEKRRLEEGMDMCFPNNSNPYLKEGRLADVLSLIQVLGLDSLTYRSETGSDGEDGKGGLTHELKAKPSSADSWLTIAKEHKEFFRVDETKKYPISLICRHIYKTSPTLNEEEFDRSFIHQLMSVAIELHDREVKRAQGWTFYIPIWVAAISGAFLLLKEFLK